MASAKEVQLQKELNAEKQRSQQLEKLIGVERQSSLDLSYSLLETLKETLGIQTKSSQQDKDILKVNKEINRAIVDRSSSYTSISSLQKEIAKNEALATKGRNQSLNIERTLSDKQKEKVADAVAINREIADQVITLEKLENQQKNSVNLSEEEAKELQNKIEEI